MWTSGVVRAIDEETVVKFVGNVRLNPSNHNKSYISQKTAVSLEEYTRYRAE